MTSARPPIVPRLSLEQKLPLVIGGLLAVSIAAIATASYVEVRRTSHRLAAERLQSVTRQLRDLLGQNRPQILSQSAASAAKPALARYAVTRDPTLRARALEDLASVALTQVVASELRDTATVLATRPVGATFKPPPLRHLVQDDRDIVPGVVGPLESWGDTVVYPVATPVPNAAGSWVVHWRRQAANPRARELIAELIGENVELHVGNADGSFWTDLGRPVPPLPIQPADSVRVQPYTSAANGVRYLAATAPLPGTPWVVAVSIPYSVVAQPAAIHARRILLIGVAALLLGLGVAWVVSRHITQPLRQLTLSAGAIAAGDFSRPVRIRRADELGQLGATFETMAVQLAGAQADLERKVDQRTHALNEALSQLQETQEALVRREKLALLGQLASGVGHELRNPLGVMMNAVYYLKTVLRESPKNVAEYLDIVQQQITLSEKIVSDLLDFARAKPPQREPVALADVVAAQLDRLGPLEGVAIETKLAPDLAPALADPVQVAQIVLNLLTNAVQAIDGPGHIVISARPCGDAVTLTVSDTGSGVPEDLREKIFEPLFTTKARGMGLGLAVSRVLARANGGDLALDATPRGGASFRLTLPVPAPVPA